MLKIDFTDPLWNSPVIANVVSGIFGTIIAIITGLFLLKSKLLEAWLKAWFERRHSSSRQPPAVEVGDSPKDHDKGRQKSSGKRFRKYKYLIICLVIGLAAGLIFRAVVRNNRDTFNNQPDDSSAAPDGFHGFQLNESTTATEAATSTDQPSTSYDVLNTDSLQELVTNAQNYYDKNDFENQRATSQKAITRMENSGDIASKEYANMLVFYAIAHGHIDFAQNADEADEIFEKALGIYYSLGEPDDLTGARWTYLRRGDVYYDNGDWSTALDYYVESYKASNEVGKKWMFQNDLNDKLEKCCDELGIAQPFDTWLAAQLTN